MALCHVFIAGRDRQHVRELGSKLRVTVVGYSEEKGKFTVDAYVNESKIPWLRKKGYEVTLFERIDEHDKERQSQGQAAVAARLKHGRYGDVIWGGGYLNVDEVELSMVMGERNHSAYFERIALPHKTWEKRECHAFRIGKGKGKNRLAIYFTSGIHAREWGGPDILVYFGMRLLRAYRDKKGLQFGQKKFTAAQVRQVVETRDIIVFPQVNPDGRKFSMDRHPMWRKNRRPAPEGKGHKSIGVDINRNFPHFWDIDRYFAPKTVASSTKPGDYETYIGPRAASEPETKNVMWLLDQYPNIQYFVDVHCYGETILYSWSADQNQSTNPEMNFANRKYDGQRGLIDDELYSEYIDPDDEKLSIRMAQVMAGAIQKVRGRKYKVEQSVGLYPTSGATDDYVYSRHLIDAKRRKTISYTLEFGKERVSTPFHPPYDEMRHVMREVSAGLLELCIRAEPT